APPGRTFRAARLSKLCRSMTDPTKGFLMLSRRLVLTLPLAALLFTGLAAHGQAQTPDALIKQMSGEVLEVVKSDKAIQGGDVNRVLALVDSKVMPHVNFERMTALSVGRHWRQAT